MYSEFDASHTFQTGFNRSNNIKQAKKTGYSIKIWCEMDILGVLSHSEARMGRVSPLCDFIRIGLFRFCY